MACAASITASPSSRVLGVREKSPSDANKATSRAQAMPAAKSSERDRASGASASEGSTLAQGGKLGELAAVLLVVDRVQDPDDLVLVLE